MTTPYDRHLRLVRSEAPAPVAARLLSRLTIQQLKWATIIAPTAFLGGFTYLAHFVLPDFLHSSTGFTVMIVTTAIAVYAFSQIVFGLLQSLQGQVLRQNRELSAVSAIATALSEPLGLDAALQASLDTAMEVMDACAGVICILDPEREELYSAAHRGLAPDIVERVRVQKLGDDVIAAEVIRTGRPVIIPDAFNDPRVAALCRRDGYESAVSAPVKSEGRVVGILALVSRDEGRFIGNESELLERIGRQVGIAVEKAMLFRQLVRRNRDLSALNEVSAGLSSSLELGSILDTALRRVLELTGGCAAEVWLVEGERGPLNLTARREADSESVSWSAESVALGEGLCGRVAASGYAASEVSDSGGSGHRLRIALPLKSGGESVGVMCVSFDHRQLILEPEQELLASVSAQLAVAIKNAQLYRRVQEMAILEERDRIAREMHDGFAQVLGYVNTKAMAVRLLLVEGEIEEAGRMVAQLEEAAREVYTDVREAILGLRATTRDGRPLESQIGEYLELFGRLAGIKARCVAPAGIGALHFPPATELQIIRIIQEALNNVRKHAQATEVAVRLTHRDGRLQITVADNGRGFDPRGYERGEWPQFGLQTMRERAVAVGGHFDLESAPAKGTRVRVTVPVPPAARGPS